MLSQAGRYALGMVYRTHRSRLKEELSDSMAGQRKEIAISDEGVMAANGAADPEVRIIEADLSYLELVHTLNETIFEEQRIINTFERDDLLILLAFAGEEPAGFKIGYRENRFVFYSAKGGVLQEYRRLGIARKLLKEMMHRVKAKGYARFAFDTFPNRHPGMAVLALTEGFRLTKADYNALYKDYRLRFEKKL